MSLVSLFWVPSSRIFADLDVGGIRTCMVWVWKANLAILPTPSSHFFRALKSFCLPPSF